MFGLPDWRMAALGDSLSQRFFFQLFFKFPDNGSLFAQVRKTIFGSNL